MDLNTNLKNMSEIEIKDGEIKDGEVKDGEIKDGEIKDGEVKDGEIKDGEVNDVLTSDDPVIIEQKAQPLLRSESCGKRFLINWEDKSEEPVIY